MKSIAILGTAACLLFVTNCQDTRLSKAKTPQPMNNDTLHKMIIALDSDASSQIGFWNFNVEGTDIMCITDENADRMRIMTPIAELSDVSEEQLTLCMAANFDRALDARYCVSDGHLWGAFIHPLSDLSPELFLSAIQQVYTVRATFGSDYTSGALVFGGLEDEAAAKK